MRLSLILIATLLSTASAAAVPPIKKQTSPARYLERVPLGIPRSEVIRALGLPTKEGESDGQVLLQYDLEYALTTASYIFVFEGETLIDVLYRQGNRRESAKERQGR